MRTARHAHADRVATTGLSETELALLEHAHECISTVEALSCAAALLHDAKFSETERDGARMGYLLDEIRGAAERALDQIDDLFARREHARKSPSSAGDG